MAETMINSFVMRFIQEIDVDSAWRGVVRHVQSDEEARFTRIDEALRFIGRFVDVGGHMTANEGPGMDTGAVRSGVEMAELRSED